MSKTFCPVPWNHMGIQSNGDLRQCCLMNDPSPFGKFIDEHGKPVRFDASTIDVVRNHSFAKTIRKEMMAGKQPTACNTCWKEEALGIVTRRGNQVKKYPTPEEFFAQTAADGTIDTAKLPLEHLDLRLGNLCNLKCRYCNPTESSLWINDFAEISPNKKLPYYENPIYDLVKTDHGWKIDTDDFDWPNDPSFHTWMDEQIRDGLNRIYFTGGEPTINKHHMRILDRIIQLGKADAFSLEYNSNMVAIPPRLLHQWSQFKSVFIGMSIDAIGPLAHYARHPSNWTAIERNCDAIGYSQYPSVRANLTTTISILNIRHFIDITKWLMSKSYTSIVRYPAWHVLHFPPWYSIQCLPAQWKAIIEAEFDDLFRWMAANFGESEAAIVGTRYAKILDFMKQRSTEDQLPILKRNTAKLDSLRDERMADHLPWLADILTQVIAP